MLPRPSYHFITAAAPKPRLTLHAVGAPAFPFGVLRTGKVGENGLAFVLLHSPAEVLETGHTHLLERRHQQSVAGTAVGILGPDRLGAGLHVGRGEPVSGRAGSTAVPLEPLGLRGYGDLWGPKRVRLSALASPIFRFWLHPET